MGMSLVGGCAAVDTEQGDAFFLPDCMSGTLMILYHSLLSTENMCLLDYKLKIAETVYPESGNGFQPGEAVLSNLHYFPIRLSSHDPVISAGRP